jgi:hypothetical protein
MTRKLLKTAAIVVVALAPVVATGTAEAHGGGFGGGGFHARELSRGRFRAGRFSRPWLSWRRVSVWRVFLEGFTPATMEAITPATTDTPLVI